MGGETILLTSRRSVRPNEGTGGSKDRAQRPWSNKGKRGGTRRKFDSTSEKRRIPTRDLVKFAPGEESNSDCKSKPEGLDEKTTPNQKMWRWSKQGKARKGSLTTLLADAAREGIEKGRWKEKEKKRLNPNGQKQGDGNT